MRKLQAEYYFEKEDYSKLADDALIEVYAIRARIGMSLCSSWIAMAVPANDKVAEKRYVNIVEKLTLNEKRQIQIQSRQEQIAVELRLVREQLKSHREQASKLEKGSPERDKIEFQIRSTSIRVGALEDAEVDLAKEFSELIAAQRGLQEQSRTISTADEILETIINL